MKVQESWILQPTSVSECGVGCPMLVSGIWSEGSLGFGLYPWPVKFGSTQHMWEKHYMCGFMTAGLNYKPNFKIFLNYFLFGGVRVEASMLGFIHYPTPPCLLIQVSHHFTGTGWTVSPRELSVSDPTSSTEATSSFYMGSKDLNSGLHAYIASNSAASYLPSSYSGLVPSQICLGCQRAVWAREWVKAELGNWERPCLRKEKKKRVGV